MNTETLNKIFDAYAKYLTQDCAAKAVCITGGFSEELENYLHNYVVSKVDERLGNEAHTSINAINPYTKFVLECAVHAIESDVSDPESRASWDSISELPSMHHEELNAIAHTEAKNYYDAIFGTIRDIIGRDAKDIVQYTETYVKNRLSTNALGTNVSTFNWGILNNGMWLNTALAYAYQKAGIFRPDAPVTAYYTTVIQEKLKSMLDFSDFNITDHNALRTNVSNLVNSVDHPLLEDFDVSFLNGAHYLEVAADQWMMGYTDARYIAPSIDNLTRSMTAVSEIKSILSNSEISDAFEGPISDIVARAEEVITMILLGYQALRETRYKDTFIFSVSKDVEGTIDIVVNGDLYTTYIRNGGSEEDLAKFGIYLAREPINIDSRSGWRLEWMQQRRTDIISDVIYTESERQNERNAAYIDTMRRTYKERLTSVVESYLSTHGVNEIPISLLQKIDRNVRGISTSDIEGSLLDDTVEVLVDATGDDFIKSIYSYFLGHLAAPSEEERRNAPCLAIADMAINDVVDNFVQKEPELV